MSSVTKAGFHRKKEHQRSTVQVDSIKWIPVDNGKVINAKIPEQMKRPQQKTDQKDLKVFEVRFPPSSLVQRESKANKPMTFQLIPLKPLACVDVTSRKQKQEESRSLGPPTKKLRTGSQNAQRERQHERQLERQLQHERQLECQAEMSESLPSEMTEAEEANIDCWFDQFSKSLCSNQRSDHRVPECSTSEYNELERLITSISTETRDTNTLAPTSYTEEKTKTKENTIFVKKKKRVTVRNNIFDAGIKNNKLSNMRNYLPKSKFCDEEMMKGKLSMKTKNELGESNS